MTKKVYSLFAIAVFVLIVTVISAYAQSARLVAANIPFNFMVKGKALPAGEYTIEPVQIGASQALKIQSRDGHITAIVLVRLAQTTANQDEPKLVFYRFGDHYFLSQVLGFEERSAYTLPKFRTDDHLAKGETAPPRNKVFITGHYE